jgi:hypothetical protein
MKKNLKILISCIFIALLGLAFFNIPAITGCSSTDNLDKQVSNNDIFAEPSFGQPQSHPTADALATDQKNPLPATMPFIKETHIIVPRAEVGDDKNPKIDVSKSKNDTAFVQITKEEGEDKGDKISKSIEDAINSAKAPIIYVERTKENVARMSISLPNHTKELSIIKWLLVALVILLSIITFVFVFRFILFLKNKYQTKDQPQEIICSCD